MPAHLPPTLRLVLPEDVEIVPVDQLSEELRRKLAASPGDYALSRASGRQGAKIISRELCDFLRQFREPCGIVNAVVSFARQTQVSAEDVLEEVFPILQSLVHSAFLISESDLQAAETSRAKARKTFGDFAIVRAVQMMDDTQVYSARGLDGQFVALKLARSANQMAMRSLEAEAEALTRLAGRWVPVIVGRGTLEGHAYLATEWVAGVSIDRWADTLREREPHTASGQLLARGTELLSAFVSFHEEGIVHGDVHPGNILITRASEIRVLDFGLSQQPERERGPQRGGVGFYFDPEFVSARLDNRIPPPATAAGEQYALGALLYRLITGQYYLPFSFEREEAYRQIVEGSPRPFNEVGSPPWPELEEILGRMLRKRPEDRYPCLRDAESAMRQLQMPEGGPPSEDDYAEIGAFLDSEIAQIQKQGSQFEIVQQPRISVTMGLAGRAYGLYRVAVAGGDSQLLELADQLGERANIERNDAGAFFVAEEGMNEELITPLSVLYAEPGLSAVRAFIAHARGDAYSLNAMMKEFVRVTQGIDAGKLDFAFGMPGVLSVCGNLLRVAACHTYVDPTCIRELGSKVETAMLATIAEQWSLQTASPELTGFFGAAHGWAGHLYALLKWADVRGEKPAPEVESLLDALAQYAQPFGRGLRWPRKLPSDTPEYVASWCNGAAGFVHLWCAAHQALGKHMYHTLAEAAAWSTWDASEPGLDLCCGSAGRAYALLAYSEMSGDEQWRKRAATLARLSVRQSQSAQFMREIGLYKGPIGLLALCAELRSGHASMPFFGPEP